MLMENLQVSFFLALTILKEQTIEAQQERNVS